MNENQIDQQGVQVAPARAKRGKLPFSWTAIVLVVVIAILAVIQLNLMNSQ